VHVLVKKTVSTATTGLNSKRWFVMIHETELKSPKDTVAIGTFLTLVSSSMERNEPDDQR
jgi:hypothetical protein